MNAIRQVLKVENHRVTVELPADFAAEEVEVSVFACGNTGGDNRRFHYSESSSWKTESS